MSVVQPSLARLLLAALVSFLIVVGVWALIEYRGRPPEPPRHPLGTSPAARP